MTPAALICNPFGNPAADQAYGVVPPVASIKKAYAAPTVPLGSDVVVMASAGATVIDSVLVALRTEGELLSVTDMVTVAVPAAVGVPVICPVDAFIDRPDGKPEADQLYGAVPPVALNVAL